MNNRASIRELFDGFDGVMLQSALDEGSAFEYSKRRLLETIRNPRQFYQASDSSNILGVWRDRMSLPEGALPPEPIGWCWERALDRDLVKLVPIWLWFPMRAWEERWRIYRLLIRAGFLVGPEGGFYFEFKWSWRFWRSQRVVLGPVSPWQQFCYALLRIDARYHMDVPRWT